MIILPSLEIVPAKYNGNILLSQIPVNGAGDFTVSRALNTATRVNSLGNIELVNADTPRLDYFASGGTVGCPALLVEPSASNLLLRSEEFDTASWAGSSSGTTVTANAINSPAGNLTADLVTRTTGGNIQQAIALTSGTTYTSSYFLKKGTVGNEVLIVFTGTGFSVSITVFNFDTLTLTDTAGTTSNKSIIDYGNGWYRISLTKQATSTNNGIFRIAQNNNSENYYIWGAQLEVGSVATSYIPTTTAAVTRNADVVSVSGAVSGSIGQTEGTIYLETNKLMDATLERFLSIYSSTSPTNDNISISKTTSNTINFAIRKNNVLSTYAANFSGTVLKLACAFNTASGGVAIYVNGTKLLIDTNSGSFASVLNEVYIGRLRPSVNTDNLYNGRIRAAALYTTRLTDTQLALLTSPYTSYSSMASALSYTLG